MSKYSAPINALHQPADRSLEQAGGPERLFCSFDEAIAEGDLELADACLRLIEVALLLRGGNSAATRSAQTELLRCHTHLWMLRHPEARAAA
jgi:hypothetical protein